MSKQLTLKQELFCQAYATHGNRIQAIYEAGYSPKSRRVAAQLAYKLFQQEHIRSEVEQRLTPVFSNAGELAASTVHAILNAPPDSNVSAMAKMKAIDYLARTLGWYEKKQ